MSDPKPLTGIDRQALQTLRDLANYIDLTATANHERNLTTVAQRFDMPPEDLAHIPSDMFASFAMWLERDTP